MNINTGFFVELIKIFFKDCTENCPYLGLLLCIFIFLTIAVGLAGVIHVKRKVVISFNNMNVYFTRICNYINLSCFGGNIDKFLSVRDILDEIDVLINKSGVSLTPGNFIAIKYSLVKIRELTVERCSCERFGLLIVLCWLWFKIKDIFTDKIKKIEEFSSNFENAVNNSNLSLKNEILEKVNEILKVVRSLGVDNFGKIKSLLEINTNNEFSNSISAFNRNDHASLSNDVYFRLYLRHALLAKSKKQIEEMDASSQTVATPSNPSVSSSGTGSSLATGASTSSSQGSVRSPTPGEELTVNASIDPHDGANVSVKIPTCRNDAVKDENSSKDGKDRYAYHLAVTDVFVEKAIAYLEKKAEEYSRYGKALNVAAIITIVVGLFISIFIYFDFVPGNKKEREESLIKLVEIYQCKMNILHEDVATSDKKKSTNNVVVGKLCDVNSKKDKSVIEGKENVNPSKEDGKEGKDKDKNKNIGFEYVKTHVWIDLISSFIRAFTMYGMIITAAVGFWRYGKAMLDQAERLFEKRHALRQGRLFVHLNDGKLKIDELERAFTWNQFKENAFGNMPTDASAPWGAAINESLKTLTEATKAIRSVKEKKSD